MDTQTLKHLNEAQREALEVAEASRETEWTSPSFVAELFMGKIRTNLIFPYPEQSPEDRQIGDEFMKQLESFLKCNLDPDEVDRTGILPPEIIEGLTRLGCWGMKIPKEYGGLGLSQINYNRAIALVASYCGSTAVWLSAHQSIGVPQPLKLFGTAEQKKKYFPKFAQGAISAFALTEPDVGSDPAKMTCVAVPSADRKTWTINGTKLWCTNGLIADVLVVMAQTPSKIVHGKEKKQITAFIVEKGTPGIQYPHRCDFMGIRAIQNGVIEFKNVVVPAENILWGEGLGLKLALITLNTGRLTLPAACGGMSKQALRISRLWGKEREQWGAPIAQHEAGAVKLSHMAANVFAMEAMTYYASALVDRGGSDIRLEAAMAKLFCSEAAWKIIDDLVQLRGGRGFETASSLRQRGEKGYAVERMMRDSRINRIIEGTTEIQHLFIAREALDYHMKLVGAFINSQSSFSEKWKSFWKCAFFYPKWYLGLWCSFDWMKSYAGYRPLSSEIRFVGKNSKKLSRTIFHLLLKFGPKLESHQMVLARVVEIGTELFAMACSCSKAISLIRNNPSDLSPVELAKIFCKQSQIRIQHYYDALKKNTDPEDRTLSKKVMNQAFSWMEQGIIPDDGAGFQKNSETTVPLEEKRRYSV
jgi:alkylation response protein AidB-like acyl-CoA dehydrogenase